VRDDLSLRERKLRMLWELAVDASARGMAHLDPEAAGHHARLYRERNQYADAMRVLENQFFDELAPFLAEHQVERLPRVRMWRRRAFVSGVIIRAVPADVDLAQIVEDLQQHDLLRGMCEHEADPILLAYETTLTQLREAHAHAFLLSTERGPGRLAAGDLQASRRLHMRHQSHERRMTDLNLLYAPMLADMLLEEEGAVFLSEFDRRAFPGVYPDPHDISQILIAATDAASENIAPAVRNALEQYRGRQDRIAEEMVRVTLEWDRSRQTMWGFRPQAEREFHGIMNDLQRQRAENSERALNELRHALGGALDEDLAALVDDYRRRVAGDRRPFGDVRAYRPPAVNLMASRNNEGD
jgi:hypothetical protein